MTDKLLTQIIQTADKNAIISALKQFGYIDCKKHIQYRNISLSTLFDGDLRETDEFPDSKGKRTYQGGIITNVKGYEQIEFIIISINDNKNAFPRDLLIWAKEIRL